MLASTSLIKPALSVYIFSQEENTNGRELSAWMLEHWEQWRNHYKRRRSNDLMSAKRDH